METRLFIARHSALAIALVAFLAAAGLALYVWRVRGALGRRDQVVLTLLRLVAVAGVLGAFFQPAIRREEVVRRRSAVLVLVDESASMSTLGPGHGSRAEEVARFFRDRSGWLDELEQEHEVRYFAFAEGVREVGRAALSEPLPSAGGSTDIISAIREASGGIDRGEVGGVIVLTDGIDHGEVLRSRDLPGVQPARREAVLGLPGPVHVLLSSPPDSIRDVWLSRVDGLAYVLDRNLTQVRCEVRAVGFDEGAVTVSLSEGGEELDRAEVAVKDALAGAAVTLAFLPRGPGRRVLEVSVSRLPGETSVLNNERAVVVDVVRDRLRVLHVAGHPSWDERFLRDYLRRRKDVELVSFHTLRAPDTAVLSEDDETTLIPFPAEEIFQKQTEGFDLVILQDYDLPEINRERYAAGLASYVHGGGALLVIGGSYSLGARGAWPLVLDPVLPVTPPRTAAHGMLEGRFEVEMPAEAARHPIAADPLLAERVGRAPPLAALNLVGGIDPGATVLLRAVADPASGSARHPVLVVAPAARGRTAALLTDTLWRWSFDPTFDDLYGRLLDRVVAYLTRDPAASPLRVAVASPRVGPGREQRAVVTAAPEVANVRVAIERRVAGDRYEPAGFAAESGGAGVHRFVPAEPGVFRVVATGMQGDAPLSSTQVFLVGPSAEETSLLFGATTPIAALAELTGGRAMPMVTMEPEDLALRPEVVATVGVHAEEPIWNHPAVFLFLVLALGFEWFIERKIGYT